MSTLLDAGLNLKQIQVQEFGQVIADINHNFTKILNLPGFRGLPGEEGDSITGPVGQRGNIWVFGNSERFISSYSELSTATQITAQFLSNALNDDDAKLYAVLQIEDLIDNDVVVLPSGPVVQLQTDLFIDDVLQPPTFIDTGITFANQAGVTEDRVRDIVNNLLAGIGSDNDGINRLYTAYAKNVSDLQSALNTQSSTDSAIDIDSSQASRGASVPQYRFIAGREDSIDAQTKLCLIAGHPNDYYTLLQNTLRQHNADYAPGVDNFPALVVQQNDYKSGISLGFGKTDGVPGQTGPTFRDFANIYKTETSLDIESRKSSNNFTSDASRIRLTNSLIELRSTMLNIVLTNSISIDAQMFDVGDGTATFFKDGSVTLGKDTPASIVTLRSSSIRLQKHPNRPFLSTNQNGYLVNTYAFSNSIANSATTVVSGAAVHAALADLNGTISQINASLSSRVTALENNDTSGYFNIRNAYNSGSVNLNTLTDQGTYSFYNAGSLSLSNSPVIVDVDQSALLMTFKNTGLSGTTTTQRYTHVISQIFSLYTTSAAESILFYRVGRLNSNGVGYSFTPWHTSVNTTRSIAAGGGLTGGGSLVANRTISHATSSIANVSAATDQFLTGIAFDSYGHPTSVTRANAASTFVKRGNNLSDLTNADIARTNLNVYSKDETYARQDLYVRAQIDQKISVATRKVIHVYTVFSLSTVKNFVGSCTCVRFSGDRSGYDVVTVTARFNETSNSSGAAFILPDYVPAPANTIYFSGGTGTSSSENRSAVYHITAGSKIVQRFWSHVAASNSDSNKIAITFTYFT